MFQITPAAAEQILRAATAAQQQEDETLPLFLRVAAKIEEGEIIYGMGFDETREQDTVIESCGVKLLVAPRSQALLDSTRLDFVEFKPGEFQFIFINANDPSLAGCSSRNSACGSCGSNSAGGCS